MGGAEPSKLICAYSFWRRVLACDTRTHIRRRARLVKQKERFGSGSEVAQAANNRFEAPELTVDSILWIIQSLALVKVSESGRERRFRITSVSPARRVSRGDACSLHVGAVYARLK